MVYSASSSTSVISQFTKRKKVHVNSSVDGALTDFQIKLTIAYESVMQADFDDIRFNEIDGTYIHKWIESKTDSNTADIWIITDVPASGGKDIYMYYGNSGLSNNDTGNSTFSEFFDDFKSGSYTGIDGKLSEFGGWSRNRATWTQGNYAYVTENNGMHVVNITNKSSPSVVGYVALGTQTMDIEGSGNYMYVSVYSSNKLSVVDISTPASPSEVGSVTDATKLNGIHGIALDGDYVYCCAYAGGGTSGYFTIVDVSTPSSPSIVGSIANDANDYFRGCHDVKIVGNYAFVSASNHATTSDGRVTAVDISTKSSPSVVDSLTGNEMHMISDIAVKGDYAYVGSRSTSTLGAYIRVIDISTPSSLSLAGYLKGVGMYVGMIVGNYLYVTQQYSEYLKVVDISNQTSPKFDRRYLVPDTSLSISHVHIDGTRYAIATRYSDPATTEVFYIFDLDIDPYNSWVIDSQEIGDTVSASSYELELTKGVTSGDLIVSRQSYTNLDTKHIWEFILEYTSGKRINLQINGDNANPAQGGIYLAFSSSGVRTYYSGAYHVIHDTITADTKYKYSVIPNVDTDTFDIHVYLYSTGVEVSYSGSNTGLSFRNTATYLNTYQFQEYTANADGGKFDNILIRKYTANEPTTSIGTEQHQRRIPMFM